jgi:hypothetical protein
VPEKRNVEMVRDTLDLGAIPCSWVLIEQGLV